MHVYAIQRPDGQVKIGTSTAPQSRIRTIETQGGFDSVNRFVTDELENPNQVEKAAHSLLAEHRKVGEWFCVDFDIAVGAICSATHVADLNVAHSVETFGERVRKARKAIGITQAQLASQMGLDRAALSMWETGSTKRADAEYLVKAARALGVTPDHLLFGAETTDSADAILSTLTPDQRAQALRMLKAFAESCRAPE